MALKLTCFHHNKNMADNPRDYLPPKLLYSNRQLLKLGKFVDVSKHLCLVFVLFMPTFYFIYTYYFDLLIFCCQYVAIN